MDPMLERIATIVGEFDDIEARMADPAVAGDPQRYAELAKRHKELESIVLCARDLQRVHDDLEAARELYADASSEDRDELRAEIDEGEASVERLEEELK